MTRLSSYQLSQKEGLTENLIENLIENILEIFHFHDLTWD